MSQPLYSNLGFEQPLEMSKGATFKLEIRVAADQNDPPTPLDLTGWDVRAVVQNKTSTEDILPFTRSGLDLSADGIAHLTLSASQTQTLTANDKRMSTPQYRWACELKSPSGEILPYCWGDVLVRSNGVIWN